MEFSAIDQEATTTTTPVVVMSISDVIRNANAVLMVRPNSDKEPHAYYAFIECKQSRLTWKIMPQCKSICFNFVDILEDVPRYLAILLKSSRQRTDPADRPYGYNHFQQFLTRVQDFLSILPTWNPITTSLLWGPLTPNITSSNCRSMCKICHTLEDAKLTINLTFYKAWKN